MTAVRALFVILAGTVLLADEPAAIVPGNVGRPVEVRTPDGTLIRIEPRRPPVPPVRSMVLPHVGSPYGMELLTAAGRPEPRPIPVEIEEGRARVVADPGLLSARVRNLAKSDLAVRFVVNGRNHEVGEVLVPRGSATIVPLPTDSAVRQVTALIRLARTTDEPAPPSEAIGPALPRTLVAFDAEGTSLVSRVVGATNVAAISILVRSPR